MIKTAFRSFFSLAGALALATALLGSAWNAAPARAVGLVYRVVPGGMTSGTCDTWPNGCTLPYALTLATAAGDQVWVKAGVYVPGASTSDSFNIVDGQAVYGGFAGTESSLSQRDPGANVTILSGDLTGNDDGSNADGNFIDETTADIVASNSMHVVSMNGSTTPITSSTILDGFTITGGDGGATGGGILCNGNAGGACNPVLSALTFSGNRATSGGALMNTSTASGSASPTLTDVTFVGNSANDGGAIHNWADSGATTSPSLTNATFSANFVTFYGGAIYSAAQSGGTSSPALINVTMHGNTAHSGGALYSSGVGGGTSSPALKNVILWGNFATFFGSQMFNTTATPTIAYSVVEGGDSGSNTGTAWSSGPGNSNLDPVLGALADNGGSTKTMAILPGSSAIDTGTNTGCPAFDQRGQARPVNAICDMGAYESTAPVLPTICYVNAAAGGSNDGTSWSNAYTDLQQALLAPSCDEIWVAAGVYVPGASTGDSFNILPGHAVYGGFNGTESALSERNPGAHVTILSGDIDDNDDGFNADGNFTDETAADIAGSNSTHVVYMDGTYTPIASSTVLDGFTITGGDAGPAGGGGLHCLAMTSGTCSPTLSALTFSGNKAGRGGALMNQGTFGGISSPTLTDVTFVGNSANDGGAIFNWGQAGTSSPTLTNVTFSGNSTSFDGFGGGGAMHNNGQSGASSPVLINVTFHGNTSADDGGAMFNDGLGGASSPTLTNVILWGNSATGVGDEMYNRSATPTIAYSVVEGGDSGSNSGTAWSSGAGNLDTDPALGPLSGNGGSTQTIGLLAGSSAIDTGDGIACPTHDQRGVNRPRGSSCDMGAYERIPPFSDFDPDAASDPVVFEKATGNWFAVRSTAGFIAPALGFGNDASYIPVPGDYDGDSETDPAVFEKATGNWFAVGSTAGFFTPALGFGNATSYIPVPGDYDGDGSTDAAVFEKATGNWFVVGSTSGFFAPALGFGNDTSYIPVQGDYDGDGETDPAVFEKATGHWFVVGSTSGFFTPALGFGNDTSYRPVQGDYDGDGKTDPAVFEKATGNWFVVGSNAGFFTPALGFGSDTSYRPQAADYDGDGRTDAAVFEKATGNWFVVGSTTGFFTPALGFGNDTSYIPVVARSQ